jgi:hypothetical protein
MSINIRYIKNLTSEENKNENTFKINYIFYSFENKTVAFGTENGFKIFSIDKEIKLLKSKKIEEGGIGIIEINLLKNILGITRYFNNYK